MNYINEGLDDKLFEAHRYAHILIMGFVLCFFYGSYSEKTLMKTETGVGASQDYTLSTLRGTI